MRCKENNNNNNDTFFIQGNSASYIILAASKRTPVTKKIEKIRSYKNRKPQSIEGIKDYNQ